jgi:hypothetical protein
MAARAMGPTMAGGMQPIVKDGYEVVVTPDVANPELRREGQPEVFYYIPNQIRMARKEGPDKGDWLFSMLRFAGAPSAGGNIGATEDEEVAGGVLTFTTTGALPDHVLQTVQDAIIAQYSQSEDYFWGIRSGQRAVFRPAIVTANTTTISNVSPTPRGLPSLGRGGTRGGSVVSARGIPPARDLPATMTTRDAEAASNLDSWYWHMQGQGSGSIDPTGQNAFSALLGAYPAAICYAGFHGTGSPIVVIQNMKLKFWSPVVDLRIRGNWSKVFEHFSAHAQGRYLWASVDIKAELNRMRANGLIEVELKVDATIPGGEKIAEQIEKRSDLVYDKFMEQAKQYIFGPPEKEEGAEVQGKASSAISPWGAGLALKYRRDETNLELEYHEVRQFAHLQDHTVSSSLGGMFEAMQQEGEIAEKKYFPNVYLDDFNRKLTRVVRPVAAWKDKTVEFVTAEIAYVNTKGEKMWEGHIFGPPSADGSDDSWTYRVAQKTASDVANPPADWKPDITYIKRKVHLAEPPSELDDPYTRVQIDRNVIDLDPEPDGLPLNDTTLEVRADSAGRLAVGPIELGVVLTDRTQMVEAILEPTDDQGNPIGRPQVRFRWEYSDYDRDRIWMIFTGDPEFLPFYRYQVEVTVKGTLFEPGRAWKGPWVAAAGNGPVTLTIPRPSDPGVTARSLPVLATAETDDRPRGEVHVTEAPASATNGAAERTANGLKSLI